MKKGRYTENFILASLSCLVYSGLRFLMHERITVFGYHDGGLLSYDSYYHYAFAEELRRTGNFIFFQNPFGSFDKEPHLINLYASFLKIVSPFYRNGLFMFDCTLGAIFVFLTSLCLMILLSRLRIIDKLILLFGGGIAFIGVYIGIVSKGDAMWTGFWGLTYLLNQISTSEIIYHFFFFFGLFCLIKGHDWGVTLVIVILTFLHPFTAITFNVSVIAAWLYQWVRSGIFTNSRSRLFIYSIASIAMTFFLFQVYLPSVSDDAKFFKTVYENEGFHIDVAQYGLFLVLPMVYCLVSLLFTKGSKRAKNGETLWIFLVTAAFCVVMNMSYLFTDIIIQPAHWSRVYPYVLLIAVGGLYSIKGTDNKPPRILELAKLFLFMIAIADSALGVKYMSEALFQEKRPPLFLTTDQKKIISKAKDLPRGMFLYLRDGKNEKQVGDFEYALMSMSPQKGFVGHRFFSPFLEILTPHMYPELTEYRITDSLINRSRYVIFDKKLFIKSGFRFRDILYEGNELVFAKITQNR